MASVGDTQSRRSIRRRLWRLRRCVAFSLWLGVPLALPVASAAAVRPDLTPTDSSSVRVVQRRYLGTTFSGVVVVANRGRASSGKGAQVEYSTWPSIDGGVDTLGYTTLPTIAPGDRASVRFRFHEDDPRSFPPGRYELRACTLAERDSNRTNDCRTLGAFVVSPRPPEPVLTPIPASTAPPPPPPPPGWRWTSRWGLIVQVPARWGWRTAPTDCFYRTGTTPFIDGPWGYLVPALDCNPQPPTRAMYLEFTGPSAPRTPPGGGQIISRRIGTDELRVVIPRIRPGGRVFPAQVRLARRILASARTNEVDQNRCPQRAPIQTPMFTAPSPPTDLASLAAADAASVCQYSVSVHPWSMRYPAMKASRSMSREEADRLLNVFKAAPVGTGPDTPDECDAYDSWDGSDVILVRFWRGENPHEVHVFTHGCVGNGIFDGTMARQVTPQACASLFSKDPVRPPYGPNSTRPRACRFEPPRAPL